jgi:hypothetical protein
MNNTNKTKTEWDSILNNKNSVAYNDLVKIAWPNGTELPAVPGIPVEGYEGEDLDLSHLELQNGLMSHQNYRNWCTLMEAELAVLQDIGFTIDRSKFFGQSIYASGLRAADNTNAYLIERLTNSNTGDSKSWSSSTDRAIGLHIYGSNNKVSLTGDADITTSGDYSMGVRVDGSQNDLTIANAIAVSGEEGNGIVVAYGKNHNSR